MPSTSWCLSEISHKSNLRFWVSPGRYIINPFQLDTFCTLLHLSSPVSGRDFSWWNNFIVMTWWSHSLLEQCNHNHQVWIGINDYYKYMLNIIRQILPWESLPRQEVLAFSAWVGFTPINPCHFNSSRNKNHSFTGLGALWWCHMTWDASSCLVFSI